MVCVGLCCSLFVGLCPSLLFFVFRFSVFVRLCWSIGRFLTLIRVIVGIVEKKKGGSVEITIHFFRLGIVHC